MPLLIKYYKSTTPYAGATDFSPKKEEKEHQGEFRIVDIMHAYAHSQAEGKRRAHKARLVVLTPPQEQNEEQSAEEDGFGPPPNFADLIVTEIIAQRLRITREEGERRAAAAAGKTLNALIMVLFSYGDGLKAGMVIDVQKKQAIYLDPCGNDLAACTAAQQLQSRLISRNFTVETVKQAQPSGPGTGGAHAGPLLTAGFIQLAEEYFNSGKITVEGFTAEPRLASQRLFQIYVNNRNCILVQGIENPELMDDEEIRAPEVMFADEDLWTAFLKEQAVEGPIAAQLLKMAREQKEFMDKLPPGFLQSDPLSREKVQLICDFQSRAIELVFLGEPSLSRELTALKDLNELLAVRESLDKSLYSRQLAPQVSCDLLETTLLRRLYPALGFPDGGVGAIKLESKSTEPKAGADKKPALRVEGKAAAETVSVQPGAPAAYSSLSLTSSRSSASKPPDLSERKSPAVVSSPPVLSPPPRQSVFARYPRFWSALKWLAIGLVGATILYFSGGLVALPVLAKLGAAAIPVVMPVLAAGAAMLWNWAIKPLLKCCGLFRSSQPERPPLEVPAVPSSSRSPTHTRVLLEMDKSSTAPLVVASKAGKEAKAEETTAGVSAAEAKASEASWYQPDQIGKLIYAPAFESKSQARPQSIKYVFLQKATGVVESTVENPHQSFENQLNQLRLLKAGLPRPIFACFITLEPADTAIQHFVVGLVIQNRLVMINPVGESLREGFAKHVGKARGRNPLLLSSTPIQRDPGSLVSCGPICVELLRHLSSLSEEELVRGLDRATKTSKTHPTLGSYQAIDLAQAGLLPSSLQGLMAASSSAEYQKKMQGIRNMHELLLAQTADMDESVYDERELMYRLLMPEAGEQGREAEMESARNRLTLLNLEDDKTFKRLRSRFAPPGAFPPAISHGPGSPRHFPGAGSGHAASGAASSRGTAAPSPLLRSAPSRNLTCP